MKPRPQIAGAKAVRAERFSALLNGAQLPRLRRRRDVMSALIADSPTAFWVIASGGKTLTYINPAWTRITGHPIAIGDDVRRLHEAFHPEDAQSALRALAAPSGGGADFECRILRPDRTMRWVHVRTFPLDSARVGGSLDDITAGKEANLRAQRRKDDFVATVSHELRTPLTSITASLGLLLAGKAGTLPEPALNLIRIAHSNSQRLVRLISDVLDLEKIESDEVAYYLDRVDVRTLVQNSVDAILDYAHSMNVRLRIDAEATAEVCADADRLMQVFTNLLSNAVKFSPVGQEVLVSVARKSNGIRISVRDHGGGIPENFKPHIFERFAQAEIKEHSERRPKGTGLGLSIVHEIVTRLGGEVSFEDAPGGGTVFHVELPYMHLADQPMHAADRKDVA